MNWPLFERIPSSNQCTSDHLLDLFLSYVAEKKIELYPAQEEAILALLEGKNVILNTPTGSGKSLVALALHFQSLAQGKRSLYTCPIKALVNEKFRDLCAAFGPDQVGMVTGDGSVNARAPIICCTAEILANLALREGELARVDDVVMDEFHYYSDKQRGLAWQVPLLSLPQTRFLLMSATLGETEFFKQGLTELNKHSTEIVQSNDRPVPLDFDYRETPLHETVSDLLAQGLGPIYLVNFSQREAAEEAQNLMSVNFTSKEEKLKINEALEGMKYQSPYGPEIRKLLRHGVGLHHAGLLPKYRVLVERLAQQGLLKVISGTDTLGVGVNVPIRTVLFTKLCKYNGEKTSLLSAREFHQISGRAGRRGFDTRGMVAAQAPAHVIENMRLKAKAGADSKKLRKIVPRNPPPHGFVMWTKETFHKLMGAQPEALISRFQVNHSMLLSVLSRPSGGCKAMQLLIRKSHDTPAAKKGLRKIGFELFRSLLDRKIVEYANGQIRVHGDLQVDFSLHQTLGLYLLDALKLLDAQDTNYALDLLTLAESILESPDLILRRQLDRLKTIKMAEMKAAGIEYDERIEELEKLEPPKPNREFIYLTFNAFSDAHPWVGQENIRPKSIAREMYENFHSFAEYIREYDLHRIEGLLLRYLSEVYKVIEQTVPDSAKTTEVSAIATYFGAMVRQVDSSLLEDWEKLRLAPKVQNADSAQVETTPIEEPDITTDVKAFTFLVRNEVHGFVRALATKDYEAALERIALPPGEDQWNAATIEKCLVDYYLDHQGIQTDPAARHPQHTTISMDKEFWNVEQRLVDPEQHNDWVVNMRVNLAEARATGLKLQLVSICAL